MRIQTGDGKRSQDVSDLEIVVGEDGDDTSQVEAAGKVKVTLPPGGGGSQPIEIVRIPLTFDTDDLVVTGISAYSPDGGDVLLVSLATMETTEVWDGTDPILFLTFAGFLLPFGGKGDTTNIATAFGLANTATFAGLGGGTPAGSPIATGATGFLPSLFTVPLDGSKDIVAVVASGVDGGGGDPTSTQGAGTLILPVLKAAA